MRTPYLPYLPYLPYPFSLPSLMLSLSLAACGGSPAAEGSPEVRVTVVASAPGGTVVSEPVGLFCGSTCTASFPVGTTLRLSATPPPGTRSSARSSPTTTDGYASPSEANRHTEVGSPTRGAEPCASVGNRQDNLVLESAMKAAHKKMPISM